MLKNLFVLSPEGEPGQPEGGKAPDPKNTVPTASEEAQALLDMQDKVNKLEVENAGLREAKKNYYDTVLNKRVPNKDNGPKERTVKEIREEILKTKKTNTDLRNAELYLELSKAAKKETGINGFTPRGTDPDSGGQIRATADESQSAEEYEEFLQHCVDFAQGDPSRFRAEHDRIIKPYNSQRFGY